MLDILRRIVHEVNSAPDLARALDLIVRNVKHSMQADVCSVYLCDANGDEHVLMATDGLNPDAVGKVRLPIGAGLIGLVHERAEPVNLDDAPSRRVPRGACYNRGLARSERSARVLTGALSSAG